MKNRFTRHLLWMWVLFWGLTASGFGAEVGLQAKLFAHRGVTSQYPENSMAAINKAVDMGIAGTEIDLRTTQDGHIVLLHDERLDRTTTGTGPVAARTLAEIRSFFLKDRHGRPTAEKVPTFDEVLQQVAPHAPFQLALDLKQVDGAQAGRMVLARNMADRVYFFISDPMEVDTARRIKGVSPELQIAVDLLTWWKIEGLPAFVVKALDADALFASEWFFPRCGFQEAEAAGAKVIVYLWGEHDLAQRAQRAMDLGAHIVSSERPGILLEQAP